MTKHSRRITEKQLLFTVFCFLQASPLFQTLLFSNAVQESWLAVIVSALIGAVALFPILFLYKYNRGLELSGICKRALGKFGGTVISVTYLLYFFVSMCTKVSSFGGFMSTNILQRTPVLVITAFFIIGAVMCANRGAENLCGMAIIFAVTTSVYIIFSVIFLADEMKLENLLPLFSLSGGSYVKAILSTAVEPFANFVIFLMLFDENEQVKDSLQDTSQKKNSSFPSALFKAVITGYIVSAIILIIAVFRDNAVFGEFSKYVAAPSFQAARLISIGELLSRVELVFAVIFMTSVLFRVALSLYCVSKLFANITSRGGSTTYVLPIGILMCGLSLILFKSHEHMQRWSRTALPFYNWIFEIILPLIFLVICIVKTVVAAKQGKKKSLSENSASVTNKDGKTLYRATMIISCSITGIILFLLLIFNYRFPSPIEPARLLADAFFKIFK